MLAGIQHYDIERYWPHVAPLLQKALDKGQGDYSLEDIKDRLTARKYQLWVWHVDNKIITAAVTCIAELPQTNICCLLLIGGKGLKLWKDDGAKIIEAWARDKGCSALEGYDTRSWLRILMQHGWKKVWVTIRKEL